MDEWMNEYMNERMNEGMNIWMNKWINERMNEGMNEWMSLDASNNGFINSSAVFVRWPQSEYVLSANR